MLGVTGGSEKRCTSVTEFEFFPRIEFLRGVAALTVVRDHVHGQLSASPAHGWFDGFAFQILVIVSNGVGGVVTFFVLSGFVLARSLDGTTASYIGNLPRRLQGASGKTAERGWRDYSALGGAW
jgi:peptidoglycan/LPS O-acetylase OafA/YrhL